MRRTVLLRSVLVCALAALAACGGRAHTLALRPPAVAARVLAPVTTSSTTTTSTSTTTTTVPPPPPPPPHPVPIPVIGRVATREPVVYVTIDDGWVRDPAVLEFVQRTHWPVTLFLIARAAGRDPEYFRALQAAGAMIEDHTIDHPHLAGLSYDDQASEICDAKQQLAFAFGVPPRLVRPPYGSIGPDTGRAAESCGLDAIVQWNATMAGGHLQAVGGRLTPGSIILLHFQPDLAGNLDALARILDDAHLGVGRLEDAPGMRP